MRPALKPFLNIYRRDADVLLGLGPDKAVLRGPTPEMVAFLLACDGTSTVDELTDRFPAAVQWTRARRGRTAGGSRRRAAPQ